MALIDRLAALPPDQIGALLAALDGPQQPFVPLPGPQAAAYESEADELLYGGSAGSSKSYLLLGTAATKHQRSLILRREAVQLDGLTNDLVAMLGIEHFNKSEREYSCAGRSIKLGGMPEPESWRAYAGRSRDFIGLDEAAEFQEVQVQSLLAWLRSTDPKQRCRCILASNPPRSGEGEWVLRWFAPWLDPSFPNPAKAGELRWFVRTGSETRWVSGPGTYEIDGETFTARSRSFIPGRLVDNPYLDRSGYRASLENLPEPLRSQLLKGDFLSGREDDSFQVVPSSWVAEAQARWQPGIPTTMSALGCDIAQGGTDFTVLSARHGTWFAPLKTFPGAATPNGPSVAAQLFIAIRDGCRVVVDCGGGFGGSAFDHLVHQLPPERVIAFVGAEASTATTADGRLRFANKRAESWWKFREALCPETGASIALPPDPGLVAELTAPRWKLISRAGSGAIQIELKDEVRRRLGRSTDRGDAATMCWYAVGDRPGDVEDPSRGLQLRSNVGYSRSKPWARSTPAIGTENPRPLSQAEIAARMAPQQASAKGNRSPYS